MAVLIAEVFDAHQILYHFDGSSCLYLRGHDFEMDDLDVTVMWGRIDDAHDSLARDPRITILDRAEQSFRVRVENSIIHIMTYESDSGIG